MTAIVTKHGGKRIKERIGLGKKQFDKISELALNEGIKHCEAKGNLKKYFDKLYLSHKTANNIRIYNDKVFLFRNQTLITILNLPNNLQKITNNIKKKNNK